VTEKNAINEKLGIIASSDEMNPLGGLLGCAFPMVLNIGKNLDTPRWVQEVVVVLTSAVMPSSDEEAPSVLLMLMGCIW
jgi:hypothetical protein